MDPEYSLQDVVRCHLCETIDASLYCKICHEYLCLDCKRKHLLEKSREHNVVPFKNHIIDPDYSQDVARYHLCDTPVALFFFVKFVMSICVKSVRENISPVCPKSTNWYH